MKKEPVLSTMKDKEQENNVIDLASRTAFGGGFDDEDWLGALPLGSVFLSRPKIKPQDASKVDALQRMFLNVYYVQEIQEDTVNLLWRTPEGRQMDIWVRSLEFSRLMEKIRVIARIVPDEEKVEATEVPLVPDIENNTP